MRRRDLIAASLAAPAALAAAPASAGPDGGSAAPSLNIAGVGLPVIVGGRLRNYVFVSLRLHLGAGQTPQTMRAKEPFLRDALVRAAHRTPFTVPTDLTQLNAAAISASLMRSAATLVGRGAVTRVEVFAQAPRRRTGLT